MRRKITVFLCSLVCIFCLLISVSAQSVRYVTDEAALLDPIEVEILEEMAADLAEHYGIHAVILTVDSLNGSRAQDYADDFYDYSGYGEDGVLFLLAMSEREWYITTSGRLMYALTDYGIQQIGEMVVPFLSEGDWFNGFGFFLDTLPQYLDALENGTPVDGFADDSGSYYHGDQEEILYYEEESSPSFLLSLLCGIVISGIVVVIMRLSMNTKRPQHSAGEYLVDSSWKVTKHRDMFLYSNVSKVRKEQPSKSSGGGSSVHRSSGGRSHGGGGGKF